MTSCGKRGTKPCALRCCKSGRIMTHRFRRTAAFGGALVARRADGDCRGKPRRLRRPCTAITDDAERLACYDRALARRSAPRGADRRAAPPRRPPQPPRRAAPRPRQQRPPRRRAAPITTQPERTVRESTAPAAPAAPVAGATSAEPQIVPLVIVDVRALPGRETTFTAAGRHDLGTDRQPAPHRHCPTRRSTPSSSPAPWAATSSCPKERGRAIRVRLGDASSAPASGSGAARAARPRRGRGSSCRDRSSLAR